MRVLRIGDLSSPQKMAIAIRDLENAIQELQGLYVTENPASVQVLMMDTEGAIETWDVVSTGGCTIVKDAANKQLKIHVP